MGYKSFILFFIQIIILLNVSEGQPRLRLTSRLPRFTLPPRPTPPPFAVPRKLFQLSKWIKLVIYQNISEFTPCTQFTRPNEYWVTFADQGVPSPYCYLYPNSTSRSGSWHEAYDNCHKKGATLVSIHSFRTNYILTHPLRLTVGMTSVYWTGLTSLNGNKGVYKWSDNTPVQYTPWAVTTSTGIPLPRSRLDLGKQGVKRMAIINQFN